jgi:hypothetical protein
MTTQPNPVQQRRWTLARFYSNICYFNARKSVEIIQTETMLKSVDKGLSTRESVDSFLFSKVGHFLTAGKEFTHVARLS